MGCEQVPGAKQAISGSFPRPLMRPASWRWSKEQSTPLVLSLEFTALHGGPWNQWVKCIQKSGEWVWRLDSGWGAIENDPVLREAIRALLLNAPLGELVAGPARFVQVRTQLNAFELETRWMELWQADSLDVEVQGRAEDEVEDSALWWAEQIFVDLWADVGEAQFVRWLLSYEQEWKDEKELPWDYLRFFIGHLRQGLKASEAHVSMASMDWGRFQALYSPQDEIRENKTLKEFELLINPTLQTVRTRFSSDEQMQILWRTPTKQHAGGYVVHDRSLDWQSAAILDELMDSPRLNKFKLFSTLSRVYGLRDSEADEILTRLLREGVLLTGESATNQEP